MAFRGTLNPVVAGMLCVVLCAGGCGSATRGSHSFRSEGDDELGRVRAVLDDQAEGRARLVVYSHDRGLRVSCDPAGWNDTSIPVVGRAATLAPGVHRLVIDRGTDRLERRIVLEPGALYVAVASLSDAQIRIFSTESCDENTVITEFASVMENPPHVDFGDREAEMTPPRILHLRAPDFPPHLRFWAVEGTVYANILVTREGRAGQICVRSSDNPLLDPYVIEAIENCRFEPASVNGVAIDTWVTLPYRLSVD